MSVELLVSFFWKKYYRVCLCFDSVDPILDGYTLDMASDVDSKKLGSCILLEKLGLQRDKYIVYNNNNNQNVIYVFQNFIFYSRSKHIGVEAQNGDKMRVLEREKNEE